MLMIAIKHPLLCMIKYRNQKMILLKLVPVLRKNKIYKVTSLLSNFLNKSNKMPRNTSPGNSK
jgi:hypothetical protein